MHIYCQFVLYCQDKDHCFLECTITSYWKGEKSCTDLLCLFIINVIIYWKTFGDLKLSCIIEACKTNQMRLWMFHMSALKEILKKALSAWNPNYGKAMGWVEVKPFSLSIFLPKIVMCSCSLTYEGKNTGFVSVLHMSHWKMYF